MSRVFEALCAHLKTHPEAEVQDAVKFLYQASFGGGHFLSDPDGAYQYLLKEAEIVTFNMFTIDGRVRHGYYSEEELEEHQIEEYSAWSAVKPFCFSLIKGKKLPESFHIVLQLSPKSTKSFLDKNQIPVAAEQVQGLYLNIRYEETKIQCVTGTSLSFFTLDKTMDQEWDKAVCQFFKVHKIPFSQM